MPSVLLSKIQTQFRLQKIFYISISAFVTAMFEGYERTFEKKNDRNARDDYVISQFTTRHTCNSRAPITVSIVSTPLMV